jgi:hypothetical protein
LTANAVSVRVRKLARPSSKTLNTIAESPAPAVDANLSLLGRDDVANGGTVARCCETTIVAGRRRAGDKIP